MDAAVTCLYHEFVFYGRIGIIWNEDMPLMDKSLTWEKEGQRHRKNQVDS